MSSHGLPSSVRINLRNEAYDRQGGRCCYCKQHMIKKGKSKQSRNSPKLATLEHIIPISRGGNPSDPDNLAVACMGCNIGRENFFLTARQALNLILVAGIKRSTIKEALSSSYWKVQYAYSNSWPSRFW